MRSSKLIVPLLFFFFLYTCTAQPTNFKCSSNSTCQALIDYVPINSTTYSDIKNLFGVKNVRFLLGANSLPLSTPQNQTIPAKQPIKIPFPCICKNGSGISNNRPIYKVKPGDNLDFIARTIFSNLLTYQKIATVNNIPNPNLIEVGQEFVIPLPCSCDDVDGMKVVHYGHVVPMGSTVQQIADEYGTSESVLLSLNGLADPNDLKAGAVLDVPLKACTSMIRNNSLDYPLIVPNGTYTFTANNCVQCKCDASNNMTLQCEPSPKEVKITKWPQCPSMQCEIASQVPLSLGNTSSSNGCVQTCAYAGYNNQSIFTPMTVAACPTGGAVQPGNDASKISLRGWSWTLLFVSLQLGSLLW